MPQGEYTYNKIILKARNELAGSNGKLRNVYIRIFQTVAESLVRIDQDVSSGRITTVRANRLRADLLKMADRVGGESIKIVSDSITEGIDLIENSHNRGMREVARIVGSSATLNPIEGLEEGALEVYLKRRGLAPEYNYKTLIKLDIANLKNDMERAIASGIQRGVSPDRLTKEIGWVLSKNDPEFQRVLKNLGPRGGKIANAVDDLDTAQIIRAKSFLKDVRRIAVTETGNAYHEANRIASVKSPVIKAVKWQVSGRHYGLPTSPDSCTYNHESNQFGLGEGVFYSDTVPPLQHPYCACYTLNVLKEPQNYGEPDLIPQAPRTVNEKGLRRFYKGKTKSHRLTNVERTNQLNRLAYQAFKGEL